MRTWMAWLAALLGMVATLYAQDRPTPSLTPPVTTPAGEVPVKSRPAPAKPRPTRDLNKLTPLQQQMFASALRGANWLQRANRPDGRFTPGHLPALRAVLEGDDPLHQYQAAFALARAACFFGDERMTAVARQAVLTLLLNTTLEGKESPVRYTALPDTVLSRVHAAAWLILAVHELPEPGSDLLDQGEQLCQFLCRQQRPDGSLCLEHPAPKETSERGGETDVTSPHTAAALHALLVSQRHRPAPWKKEAVGKALAHYRTSWARIEGPPWSEWQTALLTAWFLETKDQAVAEIVFRVCDALCRCQYTRLDPRHPLWLGAFDSPHSGSKPPHVGTAAYAENLADGCRLARELGDLPRYQRYREAQERSLQFVTTLQYAEANTQHFADWYRPALVGGFFAHHQDGTLRLDYTQQAVTALVRYLQEP